MDKVMDELKPTTTKQLAAKYQTKLLQVTTGQQRLWYLSQVQDPHYTYNEQFQLMVKGILDIKLLRQNFLTIIHRNSCLRTVFKEMPDGKVRQFILDEIKFDPEIEDYTGSEDSTEINKAIERTSLRSGQKYYNFEMGALFRVTILRLPKDTNCIFFSYHHIIMDGRSIDIIFDEINNLFLEKNRNPDPTLTKPSTALIDYAAWEADWIKSSEFSRRAEFWRQSFKETSLAVNFPTDYPERRNKRNYGCQIEFRVDNGISEKSTATCIKMRSSPFTFLLTVFNVLVSRYSNQSEVSVGAIFANRANARTKSHIGLFAETAIVHATNLTGAKTFSSLLSDIERNCHESFYKYFIPFSGLVHQLETSGLHSHNTDPIKIAFSYDSIAKASSWCGLDILESKSNNLGASKFDLTLCIECIDNKYQGCIEFNTDIFKNSTVKALSQTFLTLLENFLLNPEQSIFNPGLLSKKQISETLLLGNNNFKSLENRNTIHKSFEIQAHRSPSSIAIEQNGEGISYADLNEQSNNLAHYLIAHQVSIESKVGLLVEQSIDMVIGMLAILKAGGAYLAIDIKLPKKRIGYILNDSDIDFLLTQSGHKNLIPSSMNRPCLFLDIDLHRTKNYSGWNPRIPVFSGNLAYIVYTSGTTGNPKGVAVSHHNLINLCLWHQANFSITSKSKATQVAGLSFDALAWEVWPNVTAVAKVTLIDSKLTLDSQFFCEWLETHQITHCFLPTPIAESIVGEDWPEECQLEYLLTGGDTLNLAKVGKLPFKFINNYGPTEATVVTTSTTLTPDNTDPISIGQPITNTTVYIVDAKIRPLPMGVVGEIYIGGLGIARGYLNKPALTAQYFVPDPFSDQPGSRLYRSGDLARHLSDGRIQFLGRADSQVKLNGFRIELEEIEQRLLGHSFVKQALVVTGVGVSKSKALIAYVVGDDSQLISKENFQSQLREILNIALPKYMIPAAIVILKKFTLTTNGKIDRKSLPPPELDAFATKKFKASTGDLENLLVVIWRKLLNINNISVLDNFFDLGGSSMKIIQLKCAIYEQTGTNISISTLFSHPNIESLANFMAKPDLCLSRVNTPKIIANSPSSTNAIAVIGLAGRFPSAQNIDEFWINLEAGKDCITLFTTEQLSESGVAARLLEDTAYIRRGGVLDGKEFFDADLFNYSPREASQLDPQFCVLHECVWEGLEDAGYGNDLINNSVGLYAGAGNNFEWLSTVSSDQNSSADTLFSQTLTGLDFLCSRIAYKLNFNGPAISVQTACSTSLVAVHTACQALKAGDCDIAIAGGVSISSVGQTGYLHQTGMITSSDGYCRPFDTDANGTVAGEGAGVVVLKCLQRALKDNDNIRAVILGSAINNDGSQKIGYTAPSVAGQTAVISAAHRAAGIGPRSISYIEAHGTGTKLGDPIDLEALAQAFNCSDTGFCKIGSVKSNIGHLDAAAGIAGLIKTILSLQNGKLPPSIHYQNPNPHIDFDNSPFTVNETLCKCDSDQLPLRAGVSSFGIGGTNAHLILEQANIVNASSEEGSNNIALFSANSSTALSYVMKNIEAYIKAHPKTSITELCYTLAVGKKHLPYRRALIIRNISDLADQITCINRMPEPNAKPIRERSKLCFVFPGQGSQYTDMGRFLYKEKSFFRKLIDECFDIAQQYSGLDLKEYLYPTIKSTQSTYSLQDTQITQPILFIFEYSFAKYLVEWGFKPQVMIGHSLGEYVAACLSGVFSLKDAIKLVITRGALMQATIPGSMISVVASENTITSLIEDSPSIRIDIAAINSPNQTVLSGTETSLARIKKILGEKGIQYIQLASSRAFHSRLMDSCVDDFQKTIRGTELNTPKTPIISNLTGQILTDQQAIDPNYWVEHLTKTVQFSRGIKWLTAKSDILFLEVGPGKILSNLIRDNTTGIPNFTISIQLIASKLKTQGNPKYQRDLMISGLSKALSNGAHFDWRNLYDRSKVRPVSLPAYPFEKKLNQNHLRPKSALTTDPIGLNNKVRIPQSSGIAKGEPKELLSDIWKNLLGVDDLNPDDNLFDLGADSLTFILALERISRSLDIQLSIKEIYTARTLNHQYALVSSRL